MTQNTNPRIEEQERAWAPEAKLWTPVRDVQIGFAFPAFGPGPYNEVVREVLGARQQLPTGEQTAFMLDDVYNSGDVKDHPRAKSVRDTMKNSWLWVPQVEIWTPENVRTPGMYSVFDEKGEGLERDYTTEELEDRLSRGETERGIRFSQDRKVAFAPLNTIRAGTHKKGKLAQDGAFIATYGVDGAEKLDAVANRFNLGPYSWIVSNNTDSNIQRVSALNQNRYLNDIRLNANFDSIGYGGGGRGGYVLSVSGSRNSAKGTPPKN